MKRERERAMDEKDFRKRRNTRERDTFFRTFLMAISCRDQMLEPSRRTPSIQFATIDFKHSERERKRERSTARRAGRGSPQRRGA
jgi:hypothetical protein